MEEKSILTDEQVTKIYNELDGEDNYSKERLEKAHTMTEDNEYELESTGSTDNMPTDILGGVVPTGEEPEDIFVKTETYKDDGSAFTNDGLREAFSEYDVTDDESVKMIELINKYKNNENINYYNELPKQFKNMADGLRANSGFVNVSRNSAAKFLLSTFINDAKMTQAIEEYNEDMGNLFNESNSEFSALMKDSIDEIFSHIDEIRIEDPEKAAKIEGIKKSFEDSSKFELQMEFIQKLSKKKLDKFYTRYESECFYFNKRFNNDIKVPNIKRIVNVISKVLSKYTNEQIEKFVIVIIRSCHNLDPDNIIDMSYVYRMISNILVYEFTDDYTTDEAKELFNNISKCIDGIIELK